MLNFGLDISALHPDFKEHAGRGIGRYVRELSKRLLGNQSSLSIQSFDFNDFSLPGWVDAGIERLPCGRQTVRQQLCYPLQLGKGKMKGFDLLHFPAHMDAPSWSPVPYAVTVLDLIPLVCKDLYLAEMPGWRFKLARWLELRAIKNAEMVLAISECTARDVNKLLGVPRDKIHVTPLGIDGSFFDDRKKEARPEIQKLFPQVGERPCLTYVGGIDPRKNIMQFLRIFRQVLSRCRDQGLKLPMFVLVGRISKDRNYSKLLQLIKELNLEEDVLLTGYVEDSLMRTLMQGSSLFVFPSLYEGFGLPPLEAMALGVPVAAVKRSCMPEILGGAAHWFDPDDVSLAAEQLTALLANDDLRTEHCERGIARARTFTWDATAEATVKAYAHFSEREQQGSGELRRAV